MDFASARKLQHDWLMRPSLTLLASAVPVLMTLSVREGKACQPAPLDLVGIAASIPRDGTTGVAVDAGVVLLGETVFEAGYGWTGSFYADTLELLDEEGEPVAGSVVRWLAAAGEFEIAWAPDAPLAPDSTYVLNATLYREPASSFYEYTEEELALGASLSATFTTGTAQTPPLTAGPLSVSVTSVDLEIEECPAVGDCGLSCHVVGTETVPQLVVTLPDVDGGNAAAGYSAHIAVSANTPLPISGYQAPEGTDTAPLLAFQAVALAADGATEIPILLRASDLDPFLPCVSAIVWDPSGKSVVLDSVCATQTVSPPSNAQGGAGGSDGSGDVNGSGGVTISGGSDSTGSTGGSGGSAGAPPSKGGSGSGDASGGTGGDPRGAGGTVAVAAGTGGDDGRGASGNGVASSTGGSTHDDEGAGGSEVADGTDDAPGTDPSDGATAVGGASIGSGVSAPPDASSSTEGEAPATAADAASGPSTSEATAAPARRSSSDSSGGCSLSRGGDHQTAAFFTVLAGFLLGARRRRGARRASAAPWSRDRGER